MDDIRPPRSRTSTRQPAPTKPPAEQPSSPRPKPIDTASSTKGVGRSSRAKFPAISRRSVLILVAGLLAFVVVGWIVFQLLNTPARVTSVRYERSLSSRTTDAPVKESFSVGEPLMMVFEYEAAKPKTSATLELSRDGEVIRTIDLPYLRGEDTKEDSGKRYVSIVNGGSTKLETGKYEAKIIANDQVVISKTNFTIE